jgi:hypothetical protein
VVESLTGKDLSMSPSKPQRNQPPEHRVYRRRPGLDVFEFVLLGIAAGAGIAWVARMLLGH